MEVIIGIVGGLVAGAALYAIGLRTGLSVGEKMVATWTKTEKALQRQKTENIKEVLYEKAQIGVITD